MTGFPVDSNVLREFRPGGHANVATWWAAVPRTERFISAMTIWEARRGFEVLKRRDPARAEQGLAAVDALLVEFENRVVPVDGAIASEWARLLGEKDRDRTDTALAATARVRGLVLATRNVQHFRGRQVQVVDPFKASPKIELV